MDWTIHGRGGPLKGEIKVPPDKSISHRAVMFSSIARGTSRISNFLFGGDCVSTLEAFREMGVNISRKENDLEIKGVGLRGLKPPEDGQLYLGNSGTTMRVLSGIISGQGFDVRLTGDASLSKRPMKRVIEPLTLMGASIGYEGEGLPPLEFSPVPELRSIEYSTPVASAQVKSCILAAGLYARGVTSVTEPYVSRDHTERMLRYLGADVNVSGRTVNIYPAGELEARDISVPGDISSAAFFIVAALISRGSDLVLRNVGLNPTRDGVIRVLKRMGADIEILSMKDDVEPVGDLRIRSSELNGTTVSPEEIPLLIDEIPIIMVAALTATGSTEINAISELKVKETDRVRTMLDNLCLLGRFDISEEDDRLVIKGIGRHAFDASKELKGFGDHRIAMSMAVASLIADGTSVIRGAECADISYPGFLEDLDSLRGAEESGL